MAEPRDWKSIGVMRKSSTSVREARLDKDLEAYYRLRHDGLQPRKIDGSAKLEVTVDSPMDIDYGDRLTKEQIRKNRQLIGDIEAEMR